MLFDESNAKPPIVNPPKSGSSKDVNSNNNVISIDHDLTCSVDNSRTKKTSTCYTSTR